MFIDNGSEVSSNLATRHWPSCVNAVTAGNALHCPLLNRPSAPCTSPPSTRSSEAVRGPAWPLCQEPGWWAAGVPQSPSWPRRTGRSSATPGSKRKCAVVTAALTPGCPSPERGPAGARGQEGGGRAVALASHGRHTFCRRQNPTAACTQGPGEPGEPGSYSASQTHHQPLATGLSFPGGSSASQGTR